MADDPAPAADQPRRPVFRPSSVDEYLPDPELRQPRRTAEPPATRSQPVVEPPRVEGPSRPTWPLVLRHDELVLRSPSVRDAARWTDVRRRNRRWTGPWDATVPGSRRPTAAPTMAGALQHVRSAQRAGRQGSALPLVICVDDGWPDEPTDPRRLALAGEVTVSNIVRGSAQFASVGYWIDEQLAGRGLATRAVAMTVDHCLQVLGLHRVEVNVRPENAASLRVVEKLGLRCEGRRARYLHIDGDWRDHLCFVATAEECADGLLNRLVTSGALDQSRAR